MIAAAITLLLATALGAFGTHALRASLTPDAWVTASSRDRADPGNHTW